MELLSYQNTTERWGMQEVSCKGSVDGNPFTDCHIRGTFSGKNETVKVDGFYDGDGVYKVRFMPSFEGSYRFCIEADFTDKKVEGEFLVMAPGEGNHGPVRVANQYHFAYEDATPYYSLGTTCYVWNLQSDELIDMTLETLKNSAFNKIRFCIMPKHYLFNLHEPRSYPYEGTPMDSGVLTKENFEEYTDKTEGNHWDFTRFNVEHFRHIEKCICALMDMGIEADIIVMHPYDRWGFAQMPAEADDLYWNYVIARFAAYRNVWWSLANEYDLMKYKTLSDWERYAAIICEKDPYNHLRSIHNCRIFYDYTRPWITHCSIQRVELYRTAELTDEWRKQYGKPVVLDEIAYEGDIQKGWGNITGEELLRRFWEGALRGGYPQHGETYLRDDDIIWWSHGGKLHGESHKRFVFLLNIMKETPGIGGLAYSGGHNRDEVCAIPEGRLSIEMKVKDYYLFYYSFMRPSFREFYFDDETEFEAEVIDTWDMTIQKAGTFSGRFAVKLPAKQYMAIRLRKKSQ